MVKFSRGTSSNITSRNNISNKNIISAYSVLVGRTENCKSFDKTDFSFLLRFILGSKPTFSAPFDCYYYYYFYFILFLIIFIIIF